MRGDIKICEWCGRTYGTHDSTAGTWSAFKYCSAKCKNEANPPRPQAQVGQQNSSGGGFGCIGKIIKWIIIIIIIIIFIGILVSD